MTIADCFILIGKLPWWVLLLVITARIWATVLLASLGALANAVLWIIGLIGPAAYRLGRRGQGDDDAEPKL